MSDGAGRDVKGRFVVGNKGGPGRPAKEREERYFEITTHTVTYDEWCKIIEKAAEQARRGSHQARKFLADYLLGPPAQRHELTGRDGGAIETKHASDMNDDERLARILALMKAVGDEE